MRKGGIDGHGGGLPVRVSLGGSGRCRAVRGWGACMVWVWVWL